MKSAISLLFVLAAAVGVVSIFMVTTTTIGVQSAFAPGTCGKCASPFAPGQDEDRGEGDSSRDFATGQQAVGNPDTTPSDLAPGHEKRVD